MAIPAYPTSLDGDCLALVAPIVEGLKCCETTDEHRACWAFYGFACGQVDDPCCPCDPCTPEDAGKAVKQLQSGSAHGVIPWAALVSLIIQILQSLRSGTYGKRKP